MSIDYRLSPADTERRIRDERDMYRNRFEAAERRIRELEARLGLICPKCGATIKEKWSGVACTKCDWWYCA